MNIKWFAGGVAAALVSLGLVCPQLAEIRMHGVLPGIGVLLLLTGVAGTLAGVWCIVKGLKRESSVRAS